MHQIRVLCTLDWQIATRFASALCMALGIGNMLELNSVRWSTLQHAYGSASDIPELLQQLNGLPSATGNDEPWFSLWSALAHQGDVYSASFAAVPHVVAALASAPLRASSTYFQFPAWVEICRQKKSVPVPMDLQPAYQEALAKIPSLVAAASTRDWDAEFMVCALAAVAAAKGYASISEANLELTPKVATEFLGWFHER